MGVFIPFLSRIIAAWAVALLAHLLDRFGIKYTPDDMSKAAVEVVNFIVMWVIPTVATLAGIAKVLFDKKFNKSNASAAPLVNHGNAAADLIGRGGSYTTRG